MINVIDGRGKDINWITGKLNRRSQLTLEEEKHVVSEVLDSVRKNGDRALIEFTARFDGVLYDSAEDMVVSRNEIQEAYETVEARYIDIIRKARDMIWRFHSRQLENSWMIYEDNGVILGQRVLPIERVGVYAPGGRAAYPSSVLMNIVPARVAGVPDIILLSPPDKNKKINPYTLVAACEAGCKKIFKVGGAQAIAALAFGTSTIPKADKIVGPGNVYVTLAKKEVYGYVDIDLIAGPSEIMVLADSSANPAFVAADLLSQAEHDPMASSILVTDSFGLISGVSREIQKQLPMLSTRSTIEESLKNNGALIAVDSLNQAVDIANDLAPEHLELAVQNPFEILGDIKNAGSIFLGEYTPEPVGDYMAGTNHTLPTSGTARFFSPLGVYDFIKRSNVLFYTGKALKAIGEDIIEFADKEGFTAHANSVKVRFEK
ncbi:MAG: histidinol dehydrogenase [Clostridiales bacterium]|jgi:histidinol dehydrogenase|nr:histidinol dehydrogenase [Clostridiales bacterium]